MALSDAERQKKRREKKKANGMVWVGFWIKPEWKEALDKLMKKLRGVSDDV